MQQSDSIPDLYTQNDKLSIRLISPGFGHISEDLAGKYGLTHRKPYYFFLFMIQGSTQHGVDLLPIDVSNNELLFVLPHQIHQLPLTNQGSDYYKIGFDEQCLSLLPKQYPFLVNPLNDPKIRFTASAVARLRSIFGMLQELLKGSGTDPELILAHLHSLLVEINSAYFSDGKTSSDEKLSKYSQFKLLVEKDLTGHPTIEQLAKELALNTNSLYNIVKHHSGMSPKEFITKRLMLEAKRRLYYSESPSIKELAFALGFNDPEYFSRLFKKETGKTITAFVQDLSGN